MLALDARTDPGLLLEPSLQRGVGHDLSVHDLEGALLARASLEDAVHGAHATLVERFDHGELPGDHDARRETAARDNCRVRTSHWHPKNTTCNATAGGGAPARGEGSLAGGGPGLCTLQCGRPKQ